MSGRVASTPAKEPRDEVRITVMENGLLLCKPKGIH
jgi:hypothetical protein